MAWYSLARILLLVCCGTILIAQPTKEGCEGRKSKRRGYARTIPAKLFTVMQSVWGKCDGRNSSSLGFHLTRNKTNEQPLFHTTADLASSWHGNPTREQTPLTIEMQTGRRPTCAIIAALTDRNERTLTRPGPPRRGVGWRVGRKVFLCFEKFCYVLNVFKCFQRFYIFEVS